MMLLGGGIGNSAMRKNGRGSNSKGIMSSTAELCAQPVPWNACDDDDYEYDGEDNDGGGEEYEYDYQPPSYNDDDDNNNNDNVNNNNDNHVEPPKVKVVKRKPKQFTSRTSDDADAIRDA